MNIYKKPWYTLHRKNYKSIIVIYKNIDYTKMSILLKFLRHETCDVNLVLEYQQY